MFGRIKSMVIKEFLQVLRDRRMHVVIFISPIIQMMIFGYAANTDIKHIPTAVYDLDNTYESRKLIREFKYSKYFDIKYYIYDEEKQDELINAQKVAGVIRFNRGFGREIRGNKTAKMQVVVDATDSNTAGIMVSYANQIIQRYASDVLKERSQIYMQKMDAYPAVEMRDRAWFNENLLSRNYYIPGVIMLIVTVMTLLLTSMAVVREKEIGTMEQLIVSPIRSYELIIGKITPFAVIAIVQVTVVTIIAVLWFNIPLRGSIPLLFGTTLIYLLTSLGFGIFISTISSTQQEAVMSTFLFFFPTSLLSGFMFPIANMPPIIQYITLLNPLRYYLVILRGIFLKGVGLEILWPNILVLLLMGVGIITLSSKRFHKRLG